MGERSKNTVDMEALNKQMTMLYAIKRQNTWLEHREKVNDINRKLGYQILGDVMVVHSLRVPEVQKEWLKTHKGAADCIRGFIVDLMREEREQEENNTIYTVSSSTSKVYNKDKVLLCNHKDVKEVIRGDTPTPSVYMKDGVDDVDKSGYKEVETITTPSCAICHIAFLQNDTLIKNRDGLFIHEKCSIR